VALRCDVGDESDVEAAFAATVDALGKVDACFATPGSAAGAAASPRCPLEEWRR
jgi:NAD(P)-dependent dehydrogenase (short-subunit alcohol dehydrogenase family)